MGLTVNGLLKKPDGTDLVDTRGHGTRAPEEQLSDRNDAGTLLRLRRRAPGGLGADARSFLQSSLLGGAPRNRDQSQSGSCLTTEAGPPAGGGSDAASLELRRVTVDNRAMLIAEGRYGEEFVRAFAAYLIAHKEPVTTPTVTWFSYRASGPTMRIFEDEDMA